MDMKKVFLPMVQVYDNESWELSNQMGPILQLVAPCSAHPEFIFSYSETQLTVTVQLFPEQQQ